MTKKSNLNYTNLNLLLARLESQLDSPEAARFNMRHFGSKYQGYMVGVLDGFEPVCKTQACLGGETVLAVGSGTIAEQGGILLKGDSGSFLGCSWADNIKDQAVRDLGLTEIQTEKLFYFKTWVDGGRGWPIKFEQMYNSAKTPQGRLYAAIRRVEHFIKTKGRE